MLFSIGVLIFCFAIVALILGTVTPSVTYVSQLNETRTFSGGDISPGDNTITVNGLNTTETGNAASTPAVTKTANALITLGGGSATLDLTAIPDLLGLGTVTLSGLTIAYLKLINPSTNANSITVAKGASNGHTGFGSSFSVTIPVGGEHLFKLAGAAVGASDKTLDITGTGSQTLKVQVAAG